MFNIWPHSAHIYIELFHKEQIPGKIIQSLKW